MKTSKVRHQLFLPEHLSRRVTQRAKSQGRARSEILVEALEAWFNRRDGGENFEALAQRATAIERRLEVIGRRQGLFWEAFARLLRHQLMLASTLPVPDEAARAQAARLFNRFIDEMAERLAGKEIEPSDDPAIEKLRRLH